MKTTNTSQGKIISGLLIILAMSGTVVSAQNTESGKEGSKIHLRLIQEVNGKSVEIDTVYTTDQQENISAYLHSLGIELAEPSSMKLAPPPPPPPPAPPLPPNAPATPDAPAPPVPPAPPAPFSGHHDIIIHMDKKNMNKEEQEQFEKEMDKLKDDINNIRLPEMPDIPDFSKEDFNFHADGNFFSAKEKEQFEKDMQKLNEEMKELKENMKHIKIEILDDKDLKDKKDEGSYIDSDNPAGSLSLASDKERGRCIYIKTCGDKATDHHVFISDGDRSDEAQTQGTSNNVADGTTKSEENIKKYIIIRHQDEQLSEADKEIVQSQNNKQAINMERKVDSYQLEPGAFEVYPNPGDGIINLSFELEGKDPVQIKMIDASGKIVYEERVDAFSGSYQNRINLTEKGKGVYLLSITQGNQWMHKKVIVK